MIDDEGTHRARRVGGLGPVDQPRGGSRRRAQDPGTASGAAGRPAGGSPGVRPRTRG